jgi:hypothetical protein
VPVALPNSTPSSHRSVAFAGLAAEDNVRVTLRNGSKEVFDSAEVQADALIAEDGRRFPYSDIASLEKEHLSKRKTIALIVAMSFIVFILFGLAWGIADVASQ